MKRTAGLEQVRKAEIEQIRQRRRTAIRDVAQNQPTDHPPVANTLVGLSLSGGGLRSACFSTGIIQALHRSGLWRYIDYLSTVSGGGYIGGYLSSYLVRSKQPFSRECFPLAPDATGRQPAQIRRFSHGGKYLWKPVTFLNRYLIGWLLINLATFSLLVAVCASVAFLWRCLDYETFRRQADLFDLDGDLVAPFIPFAVLLTAWVFAWLIAFFRRRAATTARAPRMLLYAVLPSALVAFALLLGNGDIEGLGSFGRMTGQDHWSFSVGVWGPLAALISAGLLPLLNPKRLIESGVNPKKPWERYVFLLASTAILVGLPLLITGFLARENISGYNTDAFRPMELGDLQNYTASAFAGLVLPHAAPPDFPAGAPAPESSNEAASPNGAGSQDEADEQQNASPVAPTNMRGRTGGRERAAVRMRTARAAIRKELTRLIDPVAREAYRTGENDDFEARVQAAETEFFAKQQEEPLSSAGRARRVDNLGKWLARRGGSRAASSAPREAAPIDPLGEAERAWQQYDRQWRTGVVDSHMAGSAILWTALAVQEAEPRLEEARIAFKDPYRFRQWEPARLWQRLYQVLGYWTGADTGSKARQYHQAHQAALEYRWRLLQLFDRHILTSEVVTHALLNEPPVDSEEMSKTERLARMGMLASWPLEKRKEFTRRSLEATFPQILRPRSEVRRMTSIRQDQVTRLQIAAGAALMFLVAGVWVNLNTISLHRFYRNCMAQAFVGAEGERQQSVPLSAMRTTDFGGPYHLISGTVSLDRRSVLEPSDVLPGWKAAFEDRRSTVRRRSEDASPAEGSQASPSPVAGEEEEFRWQESFLMSQLYCGSQLTGYLHTEEYTGRIRDDFSRLDLADAVAISAAALSPGNVRTPLFAVLMLIMNLRLGQWLPNPRSGRPRAFPTVGGLLWGYFRPWYARPYVFVTDGGVIENLGLVQLLRRRCRLIFAVDAGCDGKHVFGDLARAMATARIYGGVRLMDVRSWNGAAPEQSLSLADLELVPEDGNGRLKGDCGKHFVLARIKYPKQDRAGGLAGPSEGLLVYIKPSLSGDESVDLRHFKNSRPDFPHESTSDQFYEPEQVEAYRRLGSHIGRKIAELFLPDDKKRLPPEQQHVWADAGLSVEDLIATALCNAGLAVDSPPTANADDRLDAGGELNPFGDFQLTASTASSAAPTDGAMEDGPLPEENAVTAVTASPYAPASGNGDEAAGDRASCGSAAGNGSKRRRKRRKPK